MTNVIIKKTDKNFAVVDITGDYLTHIHRMYKQYKFSPKKSEAKKMSISEAKIACVACNEHNPLQFCVIEALVT